MIVGYARVSTTEQNTERQDVALEGLGCERIYIDKLTGATLDRPEFNKMMDFVREGDTLIVKSIKENLDTSTPQGKLMLVIFAGLAEFERSLMKQRQAEGIERAKLAGKYKGRKPKEYDKEVFDEVMKGLADKTMSVTKASEKLGVTRATVYNILKKVG